MYNTENITKYLHDFEYKTDDDGHNSQQNNKNKATTQATRPQTPSEWLLWLC